MPDNLERMRQTPSGLFVYQDPYPNSGNLSIVRENTDKTHAIATVFGVRPDSAYLIVTRHDKSSKEFPLPTTHFINRDQAHWTYTLSTDGWPVEIPAADVKKDLEEGTLFLLKVLPVEINIHSDENRPLMFKLNVMKTILINLNLPNRIIQSHAPPNF